MCVCMCVDVWVSEWVDGCECACMHVCVCVWMCDVCVPTVTQTSNVSWCHSFDMSQCHASQDNLPKLNLNVRLGVWPYLKIAKTCACYLFEMEV